MYPQLPPGTEVPDIDFDTDPTKRCVNIKHFYGDQLWAAGTREQMPDLGPTELESVVVILQLIVTSTTF